MNFQLPSLLPKTITKKVLYSTRPPLCLLSYLRSKSSQPHAKTDLKLLNQTYPTDHLTNLSPTILKKLGVSLHNRQHHPLNLIRQRIQNYFYKNFVGRTGNPTFAVFDNISPIVTLKQNFDNLLVPHDHPSRHPKDSYYLNSEYLLRAHTTCHTCDVISAGLDAFLTVGDVYRRDTIDKTHYPVFHQLDGTRLFTDDELFQGASHGLKLFEEGERNSQKQELHTEDTANILTLDLQKTLVNLVTHIFGKDIEYRWVNCYFPFTHPSWELEIFYQDDWLEVLGCGILEQQILTNCGVKHKAGWAFGMGLERLAMRLYSIPDIRLFWSEDPSFLSQFKVEDCNTPITYKDVSRFPPLAQDVSFWIPDISMFSSNDFYDLARSVGGDMVERVELIDEFEHPKTGKFSHTYRITYRHMHRNLTTAEINQVQGQLREQIESKFSCQVRQ